MNKWVPRLILTGAVMTLVTTPWLVAKYHQSNAPQALPSFESVVPPPLHESGPRIVYKWRDSRGVLHYADQPPSHHRWQAITLRPPGDTTAPAKAKKNDPADSAAAPLSGQPHGRMPGSRPAPSSPFAAADHGNVRLLALNRSDSDRYRDCNRS